MRDLCVSSGDTTASKKTKKHKEEGERGAHEDFRERGRGGDSAAARGVVLLEWKHPPRCDELFRGGALLLHQDDRREVQGRYV